MSVLYSIGWFSTGRDEAARDLFNAVTNSIERGEIEGEISFVFCSRQPGETKESDAFIKLVEDRGVPVISYSYQMYKAMQDTPATDRLGNLAKWRLDYDREMMSRLSAYNPDICVLAGHMLITGPELCRKYNMINLHPASPGGPVGTWQQVIWQLIESNAMETGVMMHLVTPELDKGPAVAYCTFPIRGDTFDRYWDEIKGHSIKDIKQNEGVENSLFKLIRRHGLAREFPLIISTIKAFSRGTIRINSSKIVVDVEDYPIKGYNLTDEIDNQLKGIEL